MVGSDEGDKVYDPETVDVHRLSDNEKMEIMKKVSGYNLTDLVGGGGLGEGELMMETLNTGKLIDKELLYDTYLNVYNVSAVR